MNNQQYTPSTKPNLFAGAACVIASSDEAKEMGRHDALAGLRCNPDAYVFAGENNVVQTRFRGDYTFAYVLAKGL
jgi:hypothetical protein